ncbi:hypothetical protein [Bradyrhizobium sp. SZCCHNRI1073]|uniref:hypothetical protein n=1 Tax=Bradyrhizobium sp. SZCCHNRI1073 TaxID=3057280 RepID=UPI002916D8F6|nr:hypothetical protein [Bradyrhizobium sp. SZCCHNRI1073]
MSMTGQTVARTKRKPYDPALAEYQRQQRAAEEARKKQRHATDFNRQAIVAVIEVDDPLEEGKKTEVLRSIREDPLGDLHAREMIDEAQYQAGRAFQRDFEAAETGARAIDFTREAVDGGMMADPLSEAHMRATEQLKIVYRKLGLTDSALVNDVLVHNMTRAQVAAKRGYNSRARVEYYGIRFRDCLDCMALIYGYSMERRG